MPHVPDRKDDLPPIEDRPNDTEGDDGADHTVPADLLELHEVLEFKEAADWAAGERETK